MSPARRQRLLMGALGVLVLVVGGRFAQPLLVQVARSGRAVALGGFGSQRDDAVADRRVVELRLADLAVAPAEYTVGRNLFRFEEAPPPPPPRRPPPPPEVVVVPSGPPPPPPPEPPPPVDFSLVGIFGPEGRKIAVLKDDRGEGIYNALVNDQLKEKFIVARIGFESVDITFVGFPDWPPEVLKLGG